MNENRGKRAKSQREKKRRRVTKCQRKRKNALEVFQPPFQIIKKERERERNRKKRYIQKKTGRRRRGQVQPGEKSETVSQDACVVHLQCTYHTYAYIYIHVYTFFYFINNFETNIYVCICTQRSYSISIT